jgi:hypothetical protein
LTLDRTNRLSSSFATPTNQQLESRIAGDICHSPATSLGASVCLRIHMSPPEEGRSKGGRRGASSEREGGLKSRQAFSHLAVEFQSPATDTLESVVLHRQARELWLLREDAMLIQRPIHCWPPPDALSLDPNILGVCVCVCKHTKEQDTYTHTHRGLEWFMCVGCSTHTHTHKHNTHTESERGRERQMHTQACDKDRTKPSHQNAFCTCRMCSLCLPSTGAASTFCQQARFA